MNIKIPWKIVFALLLGITYALPALPDSAQAAIGNDGARHLLNRSGFSASDAEIKMFATLSRAEASDRLLKAPSSVAVTPPPAWVDEAPLPPAKRRNMSQEERKAELRRNLEHGFELREWWFREMLSTPSPLSEKMTLFWHNHFATSQQKVRFAPLIYQQNVLLRRHALGNFGTLLHEMARDPAMLIYLDGANSRKDQPNENFAREVMELFTLGEGNYSEQNIKEVARAFTGWSIDRDSGKFMFRRGIHDYGNKTVFGRSGNFDGDQILDMLLAKPQTSQFITRKLWREFISPAPDEAEVKRMATIFQDSGYNIAKLMRALLTSDAFYAPDNRAALIKSPVEFVVGTLKTFDIDASNLRPFVLASALLGQNLFTPPNVKGWPGGEAWINTATLLGRKQLLDRLFRNDDRMEVAMRNADVMAANTGADLSPPGREARMRRQMERQMGGIRWNLDKWAAGFTQTPVAAGLQDMTRVVLAIAPEAPVTTAAGADASVGSAADWARRLVADPAYQLK